MKKRMTAILLSMIMLISLLPISAMAAAEGKWGENLVWKLDAEGTLTISGEGTMAEVVDTADAWQKYSSDIKIIIIEEGVVNISANSFRNCINVTEVRIPASVSYIEDYAFEGCKALESFAVDKDNAQYCSDKQGILYTKDMQLVKCVPYAIDEMVLPEAVLEIANDAFSDGDFENIIKCTGDAITYYGTTMFGNTIYYPEDNMTWTEAIKGAFGSNTWIPYIPLKRTQGDVDGDGQLSNADVIMVARYLIDLSHQDSVTDIEAYGDIDGDGKIGNADLIKIARIIVGLV